MFGAKAKAEGCYCGNSSDVPMRDYSIHVVLVAKIFRLAGFVKVPWYTFKLSGVLLHQGSEVGCILSQLLSYTGRLIFLACVFLCAFCPQIESHRNFKDIRLRL
jgi:hypothetical protein